MSMTQHFTRVIVVCKDIGILIIDNAIIISVILSKTKKYYFLQTNEIMLFYYFSRKNKKTRTLMYLYLMHLKALIKLCDFGTLDEKRAALTTNFENQVQRHAPETRSSCVLLRLDDFPMTNRKKV